MNAIRLRRIAHIPPTTPPTIGPTFELLWLLSTCVASPVGTGVAPTVEVVVESPVEVAAAPPVEEVVTPTLVFPDVEVPILVFFGRDMSLALVDVDVEDVTTLDPSDWSGHPTGKVWLLLSTWSLCANSFVKRLFDRGQHSEEKRRVLRP